MGSATEQKDQVEFRSKGANYTLVKENSRTHVNAKGESYVVPGERFTFNEACVLNVDSDNEDVLEFLRDHHANIANGGAGFIEVTAENQETPDPSDALAKIADAAARGDLGELTRVLQEEERTHRRPEVLNTGRVAAHRLNVGVPGDKVGDRLDEPDYDPVTERSISTLPPVPVPAAAASGASAAPPPGDEPPLSQTPGGPAPEDEEARDEE